MGNPRQLLNMADLVKVLVGTYNHVVFGFTLEKSEDEVTDENEALSKSEFELKAFFSDQHHAGSIKSVALGGRYAASGSVDESIRLFDTKKKVELGSLVQHNGTVSCLNFIGASHLLSASDDHTICIWKTKTWECLKTLKGHKDAVTSTSVHPSGRLLLSVSRDKTIRTWNLTTGRSAYVTNIKQVGDIVQWSLDGSQYIVVNENKASVYQINGAVEPHVIDCGKRILAVAFLTNDVVAFGGELEDILLYDLKNFKTLQTFKAHDVRCKALCCMSDPSNEKRLLLFSVASDGSLRVWGIEKEKMSFVPELLCEVAIPGRPTCMSVSHGVNVELDEMGKESESTTDNMKTNVSGQNSNGITLIKTKKKMNSNENTEPLKKQKKQKAIQNTKDSITRKTKKRKKIDNT